MKIKMIILDKLFGYGHEYITCTHKTTIEITKDKTLTRSGTCIMGINASKACFDLNSNLKKRIWNAKKIYVIIQVNGNSDSFYGFGNKNLRLLSDKDLVFRKSEYLCDRTVLIKCSKASIDIERSLIENLRIPGKKFSIIFAIND